LFPGGGAGACEGFVCEVNDKNNRVSSSFVAHRIRAKVEIVGVVSRIRCMTLRLPHGFMHDFLYPHVLEDYMVACLIYCRTLWIPRLLGSVSGVSYHLYKDLFGMKEVDLVPLIV